MTLFMTSVLTPKGGFHMSAETISVRNFLVTISQTAYLEQAPMTLHFINCFSKYWRYISHPEKEAALKQELDILMLIREVFISIPFFQMLDENLPDIPDEQPVSRNCILAQIWDNLEQLSNDSQACTSLHFSWNSRRGTLELTGILPGGNTSVLYEITI